MLIAHIIKSKKMENKNQLVIFIVVAIVLFLLGGILGFVLQKTSGTQPAKNQAVNSLSSKVVSSIMAYGKVTSITGRNITLTYLGDTLSIPIVSGASVFSFVKSVQQTVAFESIKIGDNLNVSINLLPTGQLEGYRIVVQPAK